MPSARFEALKARLEGRYRGTLLADAPLAPLSWFRTGGPAEALAEPQDESDLALLLAATHSEWNVLVVGLGSNLLVRDGGFPGLAIRLGKGFQKLTSEGETRIRAGAGLPDVKVARFAAERGLAGFSFLRGIPGTIGGALRMNGGAYGGEIAQIFVSARGVDHLGKTHEFDSAAMHFAYRHCGVPDDVIFTEAVFEGRPGDAESIQAEMNAITDARGSTQPVNTRTGGSTFKNPPGAKAWELIDKAGCRGLILGGAQVSELHCNFLIASPGARSADIDALGEEVRKRVFDATGVTLEWEIRRVGLP
jgi:UDP-N-acetylmuramate dehydrogenase